MKKLLALVLALVMTLSLAVVGSNAAFKDADKVNETYSEAVNVLSGMKVFQGYTDGSFQPKGAITRAEVAAIVYRLYTGDVKDAQASLYATYNKFSDMDGAKWAAGYIGYCANAGLVKGYDAKTFGPADKVTGYQALAMILRAAGYDKNNEFTGADWQLHVAQYAQQLGVLKNVKNEDLNAPASRELVAELLFRTAAYVPTVTYTAALGYNSNSSILGNTKNDTLGYKNFGLTKTDASTDKWGRPLYKWTNGKTGTALVTYATVKAAPVVTYTKAVTECDVAHDAGLKVDTGYTLYVNGQKQPLKYTVNLTDTVTKMGAQGRLIEVYDDSIVMIDTFLAKVTAVSAAAYDAQGHLRTEATIKMDVYDVAGSVTSHSLKLTNGEDAYPYAVGDYVLVNAWTTSTNSVTESGLIKNTGTEGTDYYGEIVAKATSVDGAQSVIYWNAKQHNVEGTSYDDAYKFNLDNAKTSTSKYTWFFDQYNNLIGNVEIAAATSYGVINSIWWAGNAADGSGVAKANVTYMDGTTGQLDITEMTYDDNSALDSSYAGYQRVYGKVAHNTATNILMSGDGSYFYVDSSIVTNTNAPTQAQTATVGAPKLNNVLNGHLFQFTTKDNGTVSAVEVSGNGTALTVNGVSDTNFTKFHAEKLAVNKLQQYNGGNLIVNANTMFLIRSGKGSAASPYTFKSVTGYANIDKFVTGEVDFVDLNKDNVADYVYITADLESAKTTSLFFYDGAQSAYTISQTTWAVPGYVDGAEKTIYVSSYDSNFMSALTANTLYKVALENDSVKQYVALATIGTESASSVQVTAFTGYPLADVYTNYTPYVVSVKGAEGDTYDGYLYTDAKWGSATNKVYSISSGDNGITKMPFELKQGGVDDQNVIVVYNSQTAFDRLALQVYAKDKTESPANPTEGKVRVENAPWTYTVNGLTVTAPVCYTNTANGTAADALATAVANAKPLSMSAYAPYAGATSTYTLGVAGLANGRVAVFANSTEIPATLGAASTTTTTVTWTGTLAVGNYIVVTDAVNAGATGNYYEVFVVVA